MATGDPISVLFKDGAGIPPPSNYATPDSFAAATGTRVILDFVGSGGSVDEAYIDGFTMPGQYGGGGLDFVVDYSTDGTSVGAVQWEISVEVVQDLDDQDAAGQDFGTSTDITDTPATATANFNDRTAAGSVTHANCGSPVEGDRLRVKITRDHDHATNTDDGQLHAVYVTET